VIDSADQKRFEETGVVCIKQIIITSFQIVL